MLYRDKRPLLVFLLPALILMIVMLYYPFVLNIYNSLFEINGLAGEATEFIGVGNYQYMFDDPTMRVAMFNTLRIMVLSVVFQVGLGLILALLVESIKRGQQFFRVVYFFPIVISATAIGLMFNLFYNYNDGMLNQIGALFGAEKVNWLSDENAFTMVALPVIWQYVGFYFIIILTGLSSVSEDVYESAAIDGATGFRRTWYITLPLIRDTLITCTTLAITGGIKVFDLPAVIANNGAPKGLTYFLGTYMHNQAFVAGNVDYGSAISVIIVILGVVVSQLFNRIFLDRGREGGEAYGG